MLVFDLDCFDEDVFLTTREVVNTEFNIRLRSKFDLKKFRGLPLEEIIDQNIEADREEKVEFCKDLTKKLLLAFKSRKFSLIDMKQFDFVILSSLPAVCVEYILSQTKAQPKWVFTSDDIIFDQSGKNFFAPLVSISKNLTFFTKSDLLIELARLNSIDAEVLTPQSTLPIKA